MLAKGYLLSIMFFLCSSIFSYSQNLEANRAIFLEGLGNGLIYSINLDTRFGPGPSGFGGRGGFGFMEIDGVNITSFPFVLNYLAGRNNHYLELGVGATILTFGNGEGTISRSEFDRATGIGATLSFGYRYQPLDGGLMFRAGLAPIFDRTGTLPLWPQVSLGYSF